MWCYSFWPQCKKKWVRLFISAYQSKDVTPYMHAFAMHVSEFLHLQGNIVMFTQQGLEKLNDVNTVHFQRSSNHREHEALKQLLEKRNRIEELEIDGFQRKKAEQKCSSCKLPGHNKRSCTQQSSYFSSQKDLYLCQKYSLYHIYTQNKMQLYSLCMFLWTELCH